MVSIFASLGMIVFLFLIVKKYISEKAAFFAAIFSALIPYNINYGRTLLPDTLMATFMIGGLYFFDRWLDKFEYNKNKKPESKIKSFLLLFLSIMFTSFAILMKPFVLFFAP